jgi:hypothetical protein
MEIKMDTYWAKNWMCVTCWGWKWLHTQMNKDHHGTQLLQSGEWTWACILWKLKPNIYEYGDNELKKMQNWILLVVTQGCVSNINSQH